MIVGEYFIKKGRVLDAKKANPFNCIHGRRLEVDSRAAPKVICHTCAYEAGILADAPDPGPSTIELDAIIEEVNWELP